MDHNFLWNLLKCKCLKETYGISDSMGEPQDPLILVTFLVKDNVRWRNAVSGLSPEHKPRTKEP